MDILILISDFYKFLKKPQFIFIEKCLINKLILFVFCFCLMFTLIVIISIFTKFLLFFIDFEATKKIIEIQYNNLFKYELWKNVIYIVLIGPLIEEIIFRLPLRLNKKYLSISTIFAILILIGGGLFSIKLNTTDAYIKFGMLFSSLATIYFFPINIINKIKFQYYHYYFYFITILFGMIHIGNFENSIPMKYIWFIPILILPQIIMAIFFGYIRLKNGILWSITMHSLTNLPAVVIYLLNI